MTDRSMQVNSAILEQVREAVDLSVEDWAAMLELSPQIYRLEVRNPGLVISSEVLDLVAEELEFETSALIDGTIDFKTLERRHRGLAVSLPEIYAPSAYSRLRTSAHILDYVELNHGWQMRNRILRHFQLNESIFANSDLQVNVRLVSDLCQFLASWGVTESEFYRMGKFSVVSNSETALADLFRQQKDPTVTYERCFTEFVQQYYDQNFSYSLAMLGQNRCVVTLRAHERLLDEMKTDVLANRYVCAARGGTFASIMGYLGLPDAKVTETHCVHRGDVHCRYEIDFEESSDAFKRLSS